MVEHVPTPLGLPVLGVSDFPRYNLAVGDAGVTGWAYYFPYLLSKEKQGRGAVLVDDDEGSLCLYQWQTGKKGPRLDVLFPPLPFEPRVLLRSLERCNEFNGDRSARVMRIDERDAPSVEALPALRLRQRREQYLFAPQSYGDLSGGRFRTLRRNVTAFHELGSVEYVAYEPEHRGACEKLLALWLTQSGAIQGKAPSASGASTVLNLAGSVPGLDLRGELVYLGARLVAFAFGGAIRRGLGCFFDAKCDVTLTGLNYAHRVRFLSGLTDFDVVNDGSAANRAGLRQLKDSLRPVAMHAEFRAQQKSAEDDPL